MADPVRMGVVGIDHRHIYTMISHMQDAGALLVGWWTDGAPGTLEGFAKRFPAAPRVATPETLYDDPSIDVILTAAVPCDRAGIALRAMDAGKDVMSDKPGCLSADQLSALKAKVADTRRIWSVDFSERFEVPAVTAAADLVADGAIGRVIQTLGLGPHRLNRPSRPDWFFDPARNGGILADIGAHQIDQFLFFAGAETAEVTMASTANHANPEDPGFRDFGQMALKADGVDGYVRLDWFTPDGLPTWGDGRLFLLGTEGTIELRKYVDAGRSEQTDTLILTNASRCETIDARDAGLPYFARLVADIQNRTETAMPQAHAFTVMQLAIEAQAMADRSA
ncbi:MAG: Gfo/Idh/MocA family oxidoreductase [Pseudomonadota bacterium]